MSERLRRPRRTLARPKSFPEREALPLHMRETPEERAALDAAWWLTVIAPDTQPRRPRTRGECEPGGPNAARPCPWSSCRYHLLLDVHPIKGSLKINFPDRELEDLPATCALDVAHAGAPVEDGGDGLGRTLEAVGALLNIGRERVRQVELGATLKLRALARGEEVRLDLCAEDDDD